MEEEISAYDIDKELKPTLIKADKLYCVIELSEALSNTLDLKIYNGVLYVRDKNEDNKYFVKNKEKISKIIDSYINLTKKQYTELLYQFRLKADKIEESINTIRLKNGLLCLNSNNEFEVIKDDGRFSPYNIDVEYNSEANSDELDKFIKDISCDNSDIETMIVELLGCILITDSKVQHLIFLQGPGGSGKSTFCEMVATFLGKELVSHVAINEFSDQTKLVNLAGKLLNIADDIDYGKLYIEKTRILKILSSGGIINARAIYSQPIEFENTATMLCTTNAMPVFYNSNSGTFRRLIIINFLMKFDKEKRNPDLLKELTTDEAKSALLNKCIEGLNRLAKNNYTFTKNKTLDDTMEEYYRSSDTVKAFLLDSEDVTDRPVSEVYSSYETYCDTVICKEKVTKNMFGMRMKVYGYESYSKYVQNKTVRFYKKIK